MKKKCKNCGKLEEYYAKGLCRKCYWKGYYNNPKIKQKRKFNSTVSSLKRELNDLLYKYPVEIRTKRIDLRIYGIQDALVYFNSTKS